MRDCLSYHWDATRQFPWFTLSLVLSACVARSVLLLALHYFLLVSDYDMQETKLQCVGETAIIRCLVLLLLHALHVLGTASQPF